MSEKYRAPNNFKNTVFNQESYLIFPIIFIKFLNPKKNSSNDQCCSVPTFQSPASKK